MKKDYQTKAASAANDELVMPDAVTVAMGDLAETVREGLLALAVGAGLQVMQVMMQDSVTALCGPKGAHDPDRSALRHGSEAGSVTLGGRRVAVRRPRVRSADKATEVGVPAYEVFASTELLDAMALQRMMAKALHPPLRGRALAGGHRRRSDRPVHVEVGGEPALRVGDRPRPQECQASRDSSPGGPVSRSCHGKPQTC